MRSRRSIRRMGSGVVAALCLAGTAVAEPESSPSASTESAAPARFVFPEVQAAFEADGEDGVKDWMRAMLKQQKKAGRKLASTGKKPKCGSCHESLKTYVQSPNAVDDLRAFLSAPPETGG